MKLQNTPAVRASISFPPTLYEALDEIAEQKKVSLVRRQNLLDKLAMDLRES
jgi:hypothetical protein